MASSSSSSIDGFTTVAATRLFDPGRPVMFANRDAVWRDSNQVALAQRHLNEWYSSKKTAWDAAHATREAIVAQAAQEKELVVCYWVGINPHGALFQFETRNQPTPKVAKKAYGHHEAAAQAEQEVAKKTVCAEDVMFAKHRTFAPWTLYSATFNDRFGQSWPACSTVNGGCRKRLANAGILEPYWNRPRRDWSNPLAPAESSSAAHK